MRLGNAAGTGSDACAHLYVEQCVATLRKCGSDVIECTPYERSDCWRCPAAAIMAAIANLDAATTTAGHAATAAAFDARRAAALDARRAPFGVFVVVARFTIYDTTGNGASNY